MEQKIYNTLIGIVRGEDIKKGHFKGILKASKLVLIDGYGLKNAVGLASQFFHGRDGYHLDEKYVRKYTAKIVKELKDG